MSKSVIKKRRATGIIRVSRRNRKQGAGQSPEVQRRLIVAFAEREGLELRPADIFDENDITDGNVSGGADLSDRPGFRTAVERITSREAEIILTADPSRFFRNIDVQRQVITQIEAAGGELWTVSNGRLSHATPDQELMANLQGALNHYQRRYARDKSFLAVEIAIEQGKVPWSQTPPGYLRNDQSQLTPDPGLRDAMVEAFRVRADGGGWAKVRAHLKSNGVTRSNHGTMKLLRDRLYLGEIHFGTHMPNLQAHEAIIPRDLFDRVKATSTPRGRAPKSERLLARLGVLRCSGCGGKMVVGTQTSKGRTYPFYRCGHVREDCDYRVTISAEIAERIVSEAVRSALSDAEGHGSRAEDAQEAAGALESAQHDLDVAINAFIATGVFEETTAVARLAELREVRDAAQARYSDLQARGFSVMLNADRDWDRLSLVAQRSLIAATVAGAVVSPAQSGVDTDGRVLLTLRR